MIIIHVKGIQATSSSTSVEREYNVRGGSHAHKLFPEGNGYSTIGGNTLYVI
jgi:hypothetical protein